MRLSLVRTHAHGPATFGQLHIDGVFACHTLEDELREVPGQPVHTWKIKGATAIPSTTGRAPYRVTLEHSPRFGPHTLTVHDVPGFSQIRMHAGNTVGDTEGCPLLGMAITATGIAGGTSRAAVDLVRSAVRAALVSQEVWLEISNPQVAA